MPAPASRVHGSRKVLGELFRVNDRLVGRLLRELRRVQAKAERAGEQRARTDAERRWLLRVADALDTAHQHTADLQGRLAAIIGEGGQVLPYVPDPVEARTVRKSGQTVLELAGVRADDLPGR